MPRHPKYTEEERKQIIKEKNAIYYQKNIERISVKNNESAKEYYYNHKKEVNTKAAARAKHTRTELKRLKAILAEQAEMERAIMQEMDTEKLFLPAE